MIFRIAPGVTLPDARKKGKKMKTAEKMKTTTISRLFGFDDLFKKLARRRLFDSRAKL